MARDPRGAKTRLGAALSEDERVRLSLAMLEDVLDAVRGAAGAGVFVATESERVGVVARRYGATALDVAATGTRGAAHASARAAAEAGASLVVLLPADLPALRTDDVAALIDAAKHGDVVIAPDRHERGTNALVLRPPGVLDPLFGPGSFAAHREASLGAGLEVKVVDRPGLSLDLDEPADLREALSGSAALGPCTARVLPDLLRVAGRGSS